jgi:hypothetical protein
MDANCQEILVTPSSTLLLPSNNFRQGFIAAVGTTPVYFKFGLGCTPLSYTCYVLKYGTFDYSGYTGDITACTDSLNTYIQVTSLDVTPLNK